MSMHCTEVPPLSKQSIENKTLSFIKNKMPNFYNQPLKLPLLQIFESGFLEYLVGFSEDIQELPDEIEAVTDFTNKLIILSEETYNLLKIDDGRARFTIAHEIGHALLHNKYITERLYEGKKVVSLNRGKIPAFRDSEYQANCFASALLMPNHHIDKMIKEGNCIDSIMTYFGTSYQATKIRYDSIKTIDP